MPWSRITRSVMSQVLLVIMPGRLPAGFRKGTAWNIASVCQRGKRQAISDTFRTGRSWRMSFNEGPFCESSIGLSDSAYRCPLYYSSCSSDTSWFDCEMEPVPEHEPVAGGWLENTGLVNQ